VSYWCKRISLYPRADRHAECRFKLKFSTDKVDTMVIQAIALLDDLDKEINIYSMRVKVN
jgi:RNA processing factor Prp31